MERAAGIEPACLTWKDSALPLSYARDFVGNKTRSLAPLQDFFGNVLNLFKPRTTEEFRLILNEMQIHAIFCLEISLLKSARLLPIFW